MRGCLFCTYSRLELYPQTCILVRARQTPTKENNMNVIIFILDVAGVALLLAALMLIPRAIYLKVTKKQGRAGVTRGLIAAAFGVSLLMTVNSIVLDTIRGDDTTAQVADEVDQAAINLTAAQQAWDDR